MRITIIGAGNVGSHLARALHRAGHQIDQVYSRQLAKAATVAEQVAASATDDLSRVGPESEVYLLAVRDDAIPVVAAQLCSHLPQGALLAHTSGATPAAVLATHCTNYGVFYPLQTLSREQPADFQQIPMCIDGASPAISQKLFQLALSISPKVHFVDDEQRAALHLAAVFINNFTNAMLQASHELTHRARLPQGLLSPLLRATISRGIQQEPRSVQTGPAIRSDQQTINRHLQQLEDFPELSSVYKAITAYIKTF